MKRCLERREGDDVEEKGQYGGKKRVMVGREGGKLSKGKRVKR